MKPTPSLLEDDSGVWLFPRHTPGKPAALIVCHVVNPHFDARQDVVLPRTDVPVRLRSGLFGKTHVRKVTYHAPAGEPRTLEHRIQEDNLRVFNVSVVAQGRHKDREGVSCPRLTVYQRMPIGQSVFESRPGMVYAVLESVEGTMRTTFNGIRGLTWAK